MQIPLHYYSIHFPYRKLNTGIQYKYIGNEITILITGVYVDAYIENNMVIIKGVVPAKLSAGLLELMQVSEKYAPRSDFYGFMSYPASSTDINKVATISITKEGIVKAWTLSELNYAETFVIQYSRKQIF